MKNIRGGRKEKNGKKIKTGKGKPGEKRESNKVSMFRKCRDPGEKQAPGRGGRRKTELFQETGEKQ